jgi:hypothetical protein
MAQKYTKESKVVTQPIPDVVNRYELPWINERDKLTSKEVGEKGRQIVKRSTYQKRRNSKL